MVKVDEKLCDQCGTCVSVCPTAALSMITIPEIDHNVCTMCRKCIKVCPFAALSLHSDN